MKIYKKMEINYTLPDELEYAINGYINYLNKTGNVKDDCWRTEIQVILNWCQRDNILPENEIQKLRDYYQKGGINER